MINGKTIVLTGASSGIGLEVLKLLKEGQDNRIRQPPRGGKAHGLC